VTRRGSRRLRIPRVSTHLLRLTDRLDLRRTHPREDSTRSVYADEHEYATLLLAFGGGELGMLPFE
jgi:hypothetical protein